MIYVHVIMNIHTKLQVAALCLCVCVCVCSPQACDPLHTYTHMHTHGASFRATCTWRLFLHSKPTTSF